MWFNQKVRKKLLIQNGWSILEEMNEIENFKATRRKRDGAETSEVWSTFSQRFRDIDTKYFWYIERNKKKEEDKFPWTVFQFG